MLKLHKIENRKLAGCRQTKTRTCLLSILSSSGPLTALEIKEKLERNKVLVNKTTIYRELTFLLKKDVINELVFKDGLKRYELKPRDHSHHLICLACHKIQQVPLENDLARQEKKIARHLNFKILNHSLEFYGYCQKCLK